jgi:FAD/FMN-containing dehydrogenase
MQNISPEAASEIAAALGPGGVLARDDWGPFLEEWRGRWRGAPSLIAAPASTGEAARLVRLCAARGVAMTPIGGNTGLAGGQMATNGEVLISMHRMNRVRLVDAAGMTMIAEAGVTLAAARDAAEAAGRLFPLSIGSEGSCQIGGVVSTNAGGVNVLRYGNCRDLVLGLEVVLPSGEVWNGLKRLRKDNTGYDLKQLFIGGEGTLGLVAAAALKLFPRPRDKAAAFVSVASPAAAVRLLARAQAASGGGVTSFELMSDAIVSLTLAKIAGTRRPVAQSPWHVLIEFSSGEEDALRPLVERLLADAAEAGEIIDAAIAQNEAQSANFWRIRHSMAEAMRGEGRQAKHDVSVPVADAPAFLDAADAAVARIAPGARVMAFGHLGDGNIHYDILKPEGAKDDALAPVLSAIETAVHDEIARFDGSISAEHGVGLARRDEIARRKAPIEIDMMRRIKAALDPQGIMNPGKML